MSEDIFADFKVGDMSEANYETIDLHKTSSIKLYWSQHLDNQ